MEEIWKDVEGYEGRYEVSNLGRIRSYVVDNDNGRIMRSIGTKLGYRTIRLYDGKGNSKWYPVHRLVATAFIDNH